MTRKIKYFLTSLFIIGWLFLFSPNFANANEPPAPSEQVVVSPAQQAVNTAIATATTEVAQAANSYVITWMKNWLCTKASKQGST